MTQLSRGAQGNISVSPLPVEHLTVFRCAQYGKNFAYLTGGISPCPPLDTPMDSAFKMCIASLTIFSNVPAKYVETKLNNTV